MSEEQNFQDPAGEPGQEGIQDQAYEAEGYEQQPAAEGEPDPQAFEQPGYSEQPAAEASPFDDAAFGAPASAPPPGSVPPPAFGSVPPPALGSVPPPAFGSAPPQDFGAAPADPADPAADFGGGDFGAGDFGADDFGAAPEAAPPPAFSPEPEPAAEPEPKKKKKRRKIDLKSRLSNVRASGRSRASSEGSDSADAAAFPPPPATGSVPPPKVLGPMPKVASPFAPPEPEVKPTAQQQTIKVEIGEEIQTERRAAKKKLALISAIVGVVALVAGFFVGQTKAKGDVGRKAVAGATALASDVEASNKVMVDLSDALLKAIDGLGSDTYPDELGEVLKATNVPFSGANYQGKGVGGLPGDILQQLLAYTSGVDELNKKKDQLRNLLGAAKKQFEKYVATKKKPVVNFSVVFTRQGGKMIAELVPNKEPFGMKEKWPAKYKVVRLVGKKPQDVEVEMWSKGKLTGDPLQAIPMEERTVSTFTSQKLVFGLKKALVDTKALVDGRQSQIPSEQTDGLIKDGDRIVEQLKKVAQRGR
jgi:hypothetical protein